MPEVASNIYVPCKKCETDRYHKVLSHSTATSAKIQCEVCAKKSTFKLPKPKKAKSTKPRKPKAGATPAGPTWEDLNKSIGADKAQPYSMTKLFGNKAAIKHPTFGLGYVTMSTPSKIEVVFEDGPKALIHNKQA